MIALDIRSSKINQLIILRLTYIDSGRQTVCQLVKHSVASIVANKIAYLFRFSKQVKLFQVS